MSVSGLTTAGVPDQSGRRPLSTRRCVCRPPEEYEFGGGRLCHLPGGIAYEAALGPAVDADGNAYVTGYTGSTNFPTRAAIQPNIAGPSSPDLPRRRSIVYRQARPAGEYQPDLPPFGGNGSVGYGSGDDVATGIAVDAARNIYGGLHFSTNFPTFTTFTNYTGQEDGFVLKLDATGTNVICSMYLGGKDHDFARDIAIDGAGNPIVVGHTTSTNFPVTTNAFRKHSESEHEQYDGGG